LKGNTAQWCGSSNQGSNGWAAIHRSDLNFSGTQALLMLAATSGKTVTLFLNRDNLGFCKIGYVAVDE
jgi:hypothetical protein